ncbi:hypothetical protein NDU88_005214 [Pleurodeles waltl]|uniref:Uncharacterized protein n=1 Tax=Pleurodeles waltl TaxID=8319 RepID=A0AAV7N561_PLEWA|nr:hypothetical protein NDU88_005214 [Pleurodeles waltl]
MVCWHRGPTSGIILHRTTTLTSGGGRERQKAPRCWGPLGSSLEAKRPLRAPLHSGPVTLSETARVKECAQEQCNKKGCGLGCSCGRVVTRQSNHHPMDQGGPRRNQAYMAEVGQPAESCYADTGDPALTSNQSHPK